MKFNRMQEVLKLVRFVIVGGTTFVFQSFLYFVFSRWLFLDMPNIASYMLAIGFAAVQNYVMHRAWTFGDQKTAQGSAFRFLTVLSLGIGLNIVIFWICYGLLGIHDLVSAFIAGIIVPLFTFLTHRFWTFHENPGAALSRIVPTRDRLVS